MQTYDLVMLAILVGAVVWGAWKGFVWQVASIASLVLSYFVALAFRAPLASVISAAPPWNVFIAMLTLFLGTSLVVWIGFNFVSDVIERVRLKEFDRQLGAMFGFVKGVVMCVIVTLFAVTLLDEPRRQAICNSRSGYYISTLLVNAQAVMPAELQHVLAPYLYPQQQPAQAQYPYDPQYQQGYAQPQYDPQWNNSPQYNPQGQYNPYPANDGYNPRMTDQGYERSYYPPR